MHPAFRTLIPKLTTVRGLVVLVTLLTPAWPAYAITQDNVKIVERDSQGDFFGGTYAKVEFELTSKVDQQVNVQWALKVNSRTWIQRTIVAHLPANRTKPIVMEFDSPAVKEGIILASRIEFHVTNDQGISLASLVKPLWFFPASPFTHRSQWLQELDISLVDPVGEAAALLESLDVPFQPLSASSNFDSEGTLILAAVPRWDARHSRLIRQALADGCAILCIAANEGQLELNASATERLPDVALHGPRFIAQLDNRLIADRCVAVRHCQIVNDRNELFVRLLPTNAGWQFLELRDHQSGGRLILCCPQIFRKDSPTPIFLLARLLERLSPNTTSPPELRK